jgi:diphosphomevalonate decarboxylase
LERVTAVLNLIRMQAGLHMPARVESVNSFPAGAGIASSASAFAALALAGAAAAGLDLDEADLSRLARRGSGSASRSVPGGFCQWLPGSDESSVATSIAPPEHWDLRDVIVIVSQVHKAVGSSGGHRLAPTSSLQSARLAGAGARLAACREALLARDLAAMGAVVEEDAIMMHAVMMTRRCTTWNRRRWPSSMPHCNGGTKVSPSTLPLTPGQMSTSSVKPPTPRT